MLSALRERTNFLHYATREIVEWTAEHVRAFPEDYAPRILDIGLGSSRDLLSIRRDLSNRKLELIGIESQPQMIAQARRENIQTFAIDIERDVIPLADASVDIVIANHVIEHLKELFWLFGNLSRVLKVGGIAIIGCPNLASWHNRAALLLGQQPPAAKMLGPHVRGITLLGFKNFIEYGGYFEVVRRKGSNFYFFPEGPNRVMERLLPSLCASMHVVLRRTGKPGSFVDLLDEPIPGINDTPYYRGSSSAADHQPVR